MLKCAFYEKEITPPLGCAIPGYFEVRQGSDVKDRLYARAFVTDDGITQAAIVSIDGCYSSVIRNNGFKPIMDRITEFTGIADTNILITYTHTHTGIPSPDFSDDASAKAAEGYHTVLPKLIADCAILAYKHLEPVTAEFAKGEVHGISFVRNYVMKNGTPHTNPPRMSPDIVRPYTTADDELPVLLIKNSAGAPVGALINFACHADTVGGTEYSGDYISELSNQLKKVYGTDFVTVFLTGACGNVNHFDVTVPADYPDHHRMMGKTIAGEAIKALAKAQLLDDTTVTVKKEIMDIPRVRVSDEKIAAARHDVETIVYDPTISLAVGDTNPERYRQYRLDSSKRLLKFLETSPESYPTPVQYIAIGDFKIFAFPAEIFCEFGKMVKQGAGSSKCMVASLSNAYLGYVPTRDLYYDTIYESLPGLSNRLDSEAGYMMVEKLLEMSK